MNKRLAWIIVICSAILLTPLIAMQFTQEVDWSLADFAVGGVLLYGSGFLLDLIRRKVSGRIRVVAIAVLVITLLLLWAELAVGLFGTPFGGS